MSRSPSRFTKIAVFLSLVAAIATGWAGPAGATALYWDTDDVTAGAGGTATGTWGASNFWNTDPTGGAGGAFQIPTANTDDLYFVAGPSATSGNLAYVVTVDTTRVANSLTFQCSGAATISGGTSITLGDGTAGNGGINVALYAYGTTAQGAVAISTPITLNNSQTWTVNAGRTLTVSGAVSGSGTALTKAGTGRLALSVAPTYTGSTYVNAGQLDLGAISLAGLGGGVGVRDITVAAGASVRRNALDNAFLNRLVETTDEIGVFTGTTGNSFDFSGSTGANLPNAFLGNWASNGAKCTYTGVITPAGDAYRLGFPSANGVLGMVQPLTDIASTPRGLIVGGGAVILTAANTFTGDTVLKAGRLFLGNPLALQNSALDLGAAGGQICFSNGAATGPVTGDTAAPNPTLGGLKGSRNFASVYNSSNQNNTGRLLITQVTGLTLNPATGVSCTYTGNLTEMAPGTTITKTGLGTQILTGINTYTGATAVNEGTLLVNGSGSLHASSAVTVNTNGTLGGTGTIKGTVAFNAGGIIAPGDRSLATAAPGTLTIANSVILSGGTTEMRLFSATADDCDKLVQSTTGDLTYGGILKITNVNSSTFDIGNSWDLFDLTSRSGTSVFSNDSDFGTVGGGSTYLPLLTVGKKWSFDYTTGVLSVVLGLIPGDADKNGVIDAADYITLKQNFGMTSGATWEMGNFSDGVDGVGTVDWDDLQLLMARFGAGGIATPAVSPPAPEPATLFVMMAAGLPALLKRRRRRS